MLFQNFVTLPGMNSVLLMITLISSCEKMIIESKLILPIQSIRYTNQGGYAKSGNAPTLQKANR